MPNYIYTDCDKSKFNRFYKIELDNTITKSRLDLNSDLLNEFKNLHNTVKSNLDKKISYYELTLKFNILQDVNAITNDYFKLLHDFSDEINKCQSYVMILDIQSVFIKKLNEFIKINF